MSTPLVSLLCHRGPVTALALDAEGRHLVTGGVDGQVRGVWPDVKRGVMDVVINLHFKATVPISAFRSEENLTMILLVSRSHGSNRQFFSRFGQQCCSSPVISSLSAISGVVWGVGKFLSLCSFGK